MCDIRDKQSVGGCPMKTIAIIDDDIHIGDVLEEILRREGYSVLRAYSGTEALYLLAQHRPDLVLLDLMLPGLSGEDVLPHIQGVPVIILSAKVDVEDKVQLLLDGAVDYITKPFHPQELLARIAVQLRRPQAEEAQQVLTVGELSLDPLSRQVTVAGQEVHLTKTEYALLKLFLQHPNQAISKSVILERISLDTPHCTDSSLKQHMSNLRKKLRQASGKEYLQSVWGIGFRLSQE